MAMFEKAEHVNVYGGSFVANAGGPSKGLDKLIEVVAPNAILNAGGRADEVQCYPGTREEVIGRLEKFMDDDNPGRKRMMWLSGPAGAGKSAIVQTVAERCIEQRRQAANFFFFRGDKSRSHSKPLVATLVYQLRRLYPALNEPLSHCLESDPLICSASIEAQFNQLISSPIETIRQSTPIQQPIMIIIDGLDECSNDEREEDQILVALHGLAHADNSPFRVLVSSRAEPQLVMSFNRLGSSVESIFLNEDYQPHEDIRRFVLAKFDEIKQNHHLAWTLSKKWPLEADINAIIDKSSGQFIYSVTVMRYIQFSSENPALSLSTILEMLPSTNCNPLAHLDAVYSHIFSKAHNIRAVKLILLARNCTSSRSMIFINMLELVGYQGIHVQSFFGDLAAIIKVVPYIGGNVLEFYHASLEDYLSDKSRSTIYYVNENEIAAELSTMCLRNIRDANSIALTVKPLDRVQKPTPELSQSLLDASTKHLSGKRQAVFLKDLIGHMERLYWKEDENQFQVLLQNWSRFVHVNNLDKFTRSGVKPKNPLASPYYKQYWMTEGYGGHEPLKPPDSAQAGVARSNIQTSPAKAISKTAGGSARKPGAFSKNISAVPPKGRGDGLLMSQPGGGTGTISTSQEEEGYGSSKQNDGPGKFSIIQVKLHYQNGTRVMRLLPDTPFSEFVNKITVKFGKKFHEFNMTFKDKDGDEITLGDDSDYDHAIETARRSSKGTGEGKLEIWFIDSA